MILRRLFNGAVAGSSLLFGTSLLAQQALRSENAETPANDALRRGALSEKPHEPKHGKLCDSAGERPVDVDVSGVGALTLNIRSPHLDYLQVSTTIVDGAGNTLAAANNKGFTFVEAHGEALPDDYLEKGTTGKLLFSPRYAKALPQGDYCELIEVVHLIGDGHHAPASFKAQRCFEVVGATWVAISVEEFSDRVTPKVTDFDQFGRPRSAVVGVARTHKSDGTRGFAALVESGDKHTDTNDMSEVNEK